MILTDTEIKKQIEKGNIIFDPLDMSRLGSNSFDVCLSQHMALYRSEVLDAKLHNQIVHFQITNDGYMLVPGRVYLATTMEYTECHGFVPYCEGKSSAGRLGLGVHVTAGKGDAGFCGHWTLELTAAQPVIVYPGMPIAQITFFKVEGEIETPYNLKPSAKYNNRDIRPRESQMFRNFNR